MLKLKFMGYLIIIRSFSDCADKQPLAIIFHIFQCAKIQCVIHFTGDDRIPHLKFIRLISSFKKILSGVKDKLVINGNFDELILYKHKIED